MRKLKEVLRMHQELRLGRRQIARSLALSPATVHDYVKRIELAQLSWPLPEDWDDRRLEAAVFPAKPPGDPDPALPDFAHIREELQTHRHLTLRLLWEEYLRDHPDGYCYSRYCILYRRWKKSQDVEKGVSRAPG